MKNNYIVGDNLELFSSLEKNSIDLIYMDPPYNTGRDFSDFQDNFGTMSDFRENFLRPRLLQCHRVLKNTGNLIVHCDPTFSHHVKMLLDEIFGFKNFINEIAWVTGGNAKNKYKMNRFHDTLVCYKKSNKSTFNPQYLPYDEEYKKKSNVKMCSIKNKEYVTTAIHNSQPHINPRPNLTYDWNGHQKQWYVSKEKMQSLHDDDRLQYNSNGLPRIKRFLDEMEGIPVRDVWSDINNISGAEKVDYATQKPVALLERIIKMFSNENDLVLDPFAGSGTTGRACLSLNRDFMLFDISKKGKNVFEKSIKDLDKHKQT